MKTKSAVAIVWQQNEWDIKQTSEQVTTSNCMSDYQMLFSVENHDYEPKFERFDFHNVTHAQQRRSDGEILVMFTIDRPKTEAKAAFARRTSRWHRAFLNRYVRKRMPRSTALQREPIDRRHLALRFERGHAVFGESQRKANRCTGCDFQLTYRGNATG